MFIEQIKFLNHSFIHFNYGRVGNFLSFCLRSPQVSIQLVSSTWQVGFNLANQNRTPQNASRVETKKLNQQLYLRRKINSLTADHKK